MDTLLLHLSVWFGWLLLVAAPIIGGCYWLCERRGWSGEIPGPKGDRDQD